jgi:hypothetical protein
MFNKIVFEARISRLGEDPRKINDTGTHVGHFPLGDSIHILDMHCEEATRPSFEIGQALIGFRGDGERVQATSASIKEPSKAFPRLRAL